MEVVVSLTLEGNRFTLRGGSPKGKDPLHYLIASWPGWARLPQPSPVGGSLYSGPLSPYSALLLQRTSLKLVWTREAKENTEHLLRGLTDAQAALQASRPITTGSERQPMPHQAQAVHAIRALHYRILLADDMGLGKTSEALWAIESLQSKALKTLVISPVSVKWNWANEIKTVLGLDAQVIDGPAKKRADQLAEAASARFIVINYDLLIHLTEVQLAKLKAWVHGGAVILDESHYAKNKDAARTEVTMALVEQARHRLLLAGTPVQNTVEDLYSQIEMIWPGTWTSIWDFKKRYLVQTIIRSANGRQVPKTVGAKNLDELNEIVNTVQIRRLKDNTLGLPPKVWTFPELTMEETSRKMYRAMKDFAKLQLDDLPPDTSIWAPQAKSAMIAALRCEQIAQGFVGGIPEPLMEALSATVMNKAEKIPGRPVELMFPSSAKVRWLLDTIHSLLQRDLPVVVFSHFNAPMFWFANHYTTKVARVLHGALNSQDKQAIIDQFQGGEFPVLFCQVTMAEGFNLTRCHDVLFYGRFWAPAKNFQAADRCHRIGTKGTVNIQVPIVRGTVETFLHRKLTEKAKSADSALKATTIEEFKEAL